MRNVIIGTAGHVDHGKTCLIQALTGKNTDRLKEEQQRGITIELGFADMTAPDGTDIGIIDVPGHEKFIRNMLAGIGGIDIVLLVVAADEGVMPQTVEHLDIMRLLDIKRGIIVITKADLADEDWLELVEDDIRTACAGSFLENAPAVRVSSYTGQGIEELRSMIFDMIKTLEDRNTDPGLLRIPVDRVFTIAGFGTVITGTLTQGQIRQGQEVMIYPSGITARVRNLQVHNNMVETAYAGQRTAVNLTGIKKEEINRGDVVAAKNSITPGKLLDVRLDLLADSNRTIKSGDRVHFYYGASETLCKVSLLGVELLGPGETCYAQLFFDEDVSIKKGDHYVIRYYSPVETIGGGIVLDASPKKHRKKDTGVIEALRIRESGDETAVLEQALKDSCRDYISTAQLAKQVGMSEQDASEKLARIEAEGRAVKLPNGVYL
ncbi:MAG: selenocysteine-specific translation elongation factor, partial [Firmicutes bacterium]|nr:selenocysteine-specific translation elongation factor [Bacillota bacterium]